MADYTLEELQAEQARRQGASLATVPDVSLDELLAEQQRRQEWSLSSSLKNLGAGAVEGTVGLAGLAADASKAFSGDIFGAAKMENSNYLQSLIAPYLPEKDPQYRYARTIGQFVGPGGVAGAGGKLLKAAGVAVPALLESMGGTGALVSDVTAGIGAQGAQDITGDSVVAPFVGAVAGGSIPTVLQNSGKAVGALFREPTTAQIRGSAADAYKTYTGLSSEAIEAALKNQPDDALAALRSTAEVTDNAAAAQMEKKLAEAGGLASSYAGRDAARASIREGLIDDMSRVASVNPEKLGSDLNVAAKATRAELASKAQTLWEQFPRGIPLEAGQAQEAVAKVVASKQGGLPYGGKVKTLISQIMGEEGESILTSGKLQDIRSDALSLLREANLTPSETRVLSTIRGGIDDVFETNLTGKNYTKFRAAADATAAEKKLFSPTTAGGSLVREDVRPINLLKNAFKGDTKSAVELKQAINGNPELFEGVKRGILEMIPRDAQNKLTPAGIKKFLSANENGLGEILGSDHLNNLKRISDDLRSQAKVSELANLASKGNSTTAQKLSVSNVLSSVVLDSMMPGGGGVVGRVAEEIRATKRIRTLSKINETIFQASLDPKFAVELLKAPTKERVVTVAEMLGLTVKESALRGLKGVVLQGIRGGANIDEPTSKQGKKESGIKEQVSKAPIPETGMPNKKEGSPKIQSSPTGSSFNPTPTQIPTQAPKQPIGNTKEDVRAHVKNFHPLLQAVIAQESNYNPKAKSSAGALGLMQVMPENLKKLKVKNPYDTEENIRAGVKLLNEEITRFKDIRLALAAYNAGAPAVKKAIQRAGSKSWYDVVRYLPTETKAYVPSVMRRYREFSKQRDAVKV